MILKTLLQLPQTGGDDRLKSNIKKNIKSSKGEFRNPSLQPQGRRCLDLLPWSLTKSQKSLFRHALSTALHSHPLRSHQKSCSRGLRLPISCHKSGQWCNNIEIYTYIILYPLDSTCLLYSFVRVRRNPQGLGFSPRIFAALAASILSIFSLNFFAYFLGWTQTEKWFLVFAGSFFMSFSGTTHSIAFCTTHSIKMYQGSYSSQPNKDPSFLDTDSWSSGPSPSRSSISSMALDSLDSLDPAGAGEAFFFFTMARQRGWARSWSDVSLKPMVLVLVLPSAIHLKRTGQWWL